MSDGRLVRKQPKSEENVGVGEVGGGNRGHDKGWGWSQMKDLRERKLSGWSASLEEAYRR